VRKALAAGHLISVNDGEEWVVAQSNSEAAIRRSDILDRDGRAALPSPERRADRLGLIYGNGEDVVSDHTDNAETTMLVEGE
jgi:hypothetical protein